MGIDLGVRRFLTAGDGRQVENPGYYEKSLERIKVRQRQLSRKRWGSRNWKKQRIRLARAYERLVSQRDDFLHKLSRFYAENYDLIAVKDQRIKNMARNRRLAGRILDASWGRFLSLLAYKAERAGIWVMRVDTRGTSKIYKHGRFDRDYNASLNILKRGLAGTARSNACGEEASTPCHSFGGGRGASLLVVAGSPLR